MSGLLFCSQKFFLITTQIFRSNTGYVNVYGADSFAAPSTTTTEKQPKPLKTLPHLTTAISSLRFNHDAQLLAVASKEKKDSMRLVGILLCPFSFPVFLLVLHWLFPCLYYLSLPPNSTDCCVPFLSTSCSRTHGMTSRLIFGTAMRFRSRDFHVPPLQCSMSSILFFTDSHFLTQIHLPSLTSFANWPTSSTPLGHVTAVDFSARSEYVAVGNTRGRVLLYHLKDYGASILDS